MRAKAGQAMIPTVALVVGHQESSKGAVSVGKVSEWDYNMKICDLVAGILAAKKLVLPCVLHPDVPHYGKAPVINKAGVSIAIEFHFNSSDNATAHGSEVLYYSKSIASKRLAQTLLDSIAFTCNTTNRE
jgi:N-acetylmuramoyl-L-alanine amidase